MAEGTVYWLTEEQQRRDRRGPPQMGLHITAEGAKTDFAMFQFPILCRNPKVRDFYRVNIAAQKHKEDITHLVMEMRDNNKCPEPQPSEHPTRQDLEGNLVGPPEEGQHGDEQ